MGLVQMELHAVTNDMLPVRELIKQIKDIASEVDFIHIRERSKAAGELVHLVKQLLAEGVPKEKLIINDRVDVALLTNIHRVHLGTQLFAKGIKTKISSPPCGGIGSFDRRSQSSREERGRVCHVWACV